MWELIQSNRRKSAALIVVLALVLAGLGLSIGWGFGGEEGGYFGVAVAMVVWIVMLLVNLAAGESILLAAAGAREVTHDDAPQLFNIVEEMKIASGLPAMPKVYVIDNPAPNAFAVGLKPERAAVAVTSGLLAQLNRDELQGVIGHELGHITNRDTLFMTLAGVTMGAVILLADLYLRGMRFGGGRSRRSDSRGGGQAAVIMMVIALVLAILAPILAQLLYFACSRRREYLADASSAQFTRYPAGLASALEKISGAQHGELEVSRALAPMFIVNPQAAVGETTSVFSTHPSTADRIRVLRTMTSDVSLAAYETAYQQTHAGHNVMRAATTQSAQPLAAREAAPAAETAQQQWRAVQNLVQRTAGYFAIPCDCGVNLKVPQNFGQPAVACPKCGQQHSLPPAIAQA
ncbi:MAG: peptidase M28 [Verrucomicrobia bacterium]|nr:MAG: peptidase M28 [Verrucomicrobiota bacterium]